MVRRIKGSEKTKIVCMSHKEDADGISSAALIKEAFGGETILVDYPEQMGALESAAADESLKVLYICDLGLSKSNQDRFIKIMKELRRRRISVTYIDHHDLSPEILKELERIKVKMIHDVNECTTVQVYKKFKSRLSEHASFVAACAAVTDYMDDRPEGSNLLQAYDRQFVLINATVLTYNIVGHQKDIDYLLYLVEELASSKYPFEIPNSFELAQIQVSKLAETISKVKSGMKTMKNLGYMEITDSGASGAVNFVLGLSGKDVGVAYKERTDQGIYAVSIRGARSCGIHLGKLTNSLAAELGGSGGGHDKACGAVIPKPAIKKFVRELNKRITQGGSATQSEGVRDGKETVARRGAIAQRLVELGIELPEPPASVGSYLPVILSGRFAFVSGQIPLNDGKVVHAGRVNERNLGEAREAARLCVINAMAQLERELGSLDRVTRVVKISGFVNSEPGFSDHSSVMNAASDLLAEIFGEKGRHARIAVGSPGLPMNAMVELDALAEFS